MDKDQDGRITRAELLMDAPQRMMGREADGQGVPPQQGGRGPGGGQGGGQPPF
jgi:hypothetical protein